MLAALRKEGIDFRGILYIGMIWTKDGPSILEFNVRGGDPETQVLLPLIDTPLVEILQAVREQRLGKVKVRVELATTRSRLSWPPPAIPERPKPVSPIDGSRSRTAGHGGLSSRHETGRRTAS